MKVRRFMPLVAAALIAVVTLALGAGTGAAKSDVKAAPAQYKVTLVTDIGGLDDRSFNFLANKGLQRAKKDFNVDGSVFISKSGRDYVPNLTRAARNGSGLVIGVGFLMADAVAQVAKRFPKTKFAIIDNSGVAAELKGKPTNVRGLLFKEQEAGYLVGFLAAKQVLAHPYNGQTKLGCRRRPQDPAGRPLHRGLLRRREAGQLEGHGHALLLAGLRRPGEVQGAGAEPDRQRRGAVFQVAGQCGLGVLSAAKEKGVFGIGVDADQGYLGAHVMTSAHEEGRRRGLQDDRGGEGGRCEVQDQHQRDLHGRERRRRVREDLAPHLAGR